MHNVICMCTIIYIARIDFVRLREAATFIVREISYMIATLLLLMIGSFLHVL